MTVLFDCLSDFHPFSGFSIKLIKIAFFIISGIFRILLNFSNRIYLAELWALTAANFGRKFNIFSVICQWKSPSIEGHN